MGIRRVVPSPPVVAFVLPTVVKREVSEKSLAS